jgi:uncharacterized protein YdbL (DUF1318 family)
MQKLIKSITMMMVLLSMAFPALALSLQDAKSQGKVGELPSGYLGAVVSTTDVKALISNVNKKRKKIYISLARKNKISVKQVAQLAAKKALKKTIVGNYIKDAAGKWVKK